MIQSQFKMSDKAFYRSRFSGILPCEVIETGPKKIYIFIEQYNKKLWVPASRLGRNQNGEHTDNNHSVG
jgi:hypothetical protein